MPRTEGIVNLLETHRRRLGKLREQQARFGYSTPPHVLMEIEDVEKEIARLERELVGPAVESTTQTTSGAAISGDSSFAITKLQALDRQLSDVTEEYSAASGQWSRALGEIERVRLKRQMDDLEAKILNLKAELARLKSSATPPDSTKPSTTVLSVRMLKVFLSHASEDKPQVRGVYRKLLDQGIDAWLDEERLLPGQDWQLEIRKAVRSSDVVLVFISKRCVTKAGYVQREIKQALDEADEQPEGAIFVIPVKLEPCDVPDRLSHVQWVDLYEEHGWAQLLRALRKRADEIGTYGP